MVTLLSVLCNQRQVEIQHDLCVDSLATASLGAFLDWQCRMGLVIELASLLAKDRAYEGYWDGDRHKHGV